ncbi:hypothetical protein [Phenylobacterium sp.]|uniref:hypothetical protein n=1 Tax=Phenylobacterium sp. TaxID=1871053 RepID=UPI002810ACC2|nr:hypothetical protein [Phenylobacterium sp.]
MPSYRIYRVGGGGRLVLGETFTAASDAEAVEHAAVLFRKGGEGELWCGGRLLGRFSKLGVFTPGVG